MAMLSEVLIALIVVFAPSMSAEFSNGRMPFFLTLAITLKLET